MSESEKESSSTPSAESKSPFVDLAMDVMQAIDSAPSESEPTLKEAPPSEDASTEKDSPDPTKVESKEAEKPKKAAKHPVTIDDLQAKLKGLEKGFHKASRENADLRKQIQELRGESSQEPELTPEQIADRARATEREEASLERAKEEYGEAHVQEQIFAEDSPYRKIVEAEPWVRDRVMQSRDPYGEAFRVIAEHELLNNYGRDIGSVKEKIKTQVTAEILKELKSGKGLTGSKPPTLSQVRGSGNAAQEIKTNAPDLNNFNKHLSAIA